MEGYFATYIYKKNSVLKNNSPKNNFLWPSSDEWLRAIAELFISFFKYLCFSIKNETKISLDQKINGKKCIKLIATCTLTYLYFIILEIDMLNSC